MKKAGEILSSMFETQFNAHLLERARFFSGFFSAWDSLTEKAGVAAAAAHSRIVNMERGVLVVEADHPGWKQILQTKQKKLLALARRQFPELEIKGISFWLARGIAEAKAREQNAPDKKPPAPEPHAEVTQ
ncbi:MAG: DUF721 domain-containing protein [Treponematales bacterium]